MCRNVQRRRVHFVEGTPICCNMDAKLLIVLLIATNCYSSCGAALRRTPRIYNALITTDDNLTSSRAYPVIQPTLHETGVHYPFGPYNPYGIYGSPLVRFGQPIAPGLVPREQIPYPLPQPHFPPQLMHGFGPHGPPQRFPGYPAAPQTPPTAPPAPVEPQEPPSPPPAQPEVAAPAPTEQQQPVQPPTATPPQPNYMPPLLQEQRPQQMPGEKLPIPLNEYGLPPALIPLQQYPNMHRQQPHRPPPFHLPPYAYNQYPLIYDPVTGFREQYLPSYEYFPSPHTFTVGAGAAAVPPPPQSLPPTAPQPPVAPGAPPQPAPETSQQDLDQAEETSAAAEEVTDQTPFTAEPPEPSFESIKNGSKSKNSAVPDVPPPPIPSGAKSKES